MKKILSTTFLSLLLITVSSVTLFAGIYKYVDENGTTVFVDEKWKIPQKNHDKTSTIKEATYEMSVEESKASEEKNEQGERKRQVSRQETEEKRKQKKRETAVRISNNRIIVPMMVSNGGRSSKLNMLIDTGANVTVIYASAVEQLHFSRRKKGSAQLAGGTKVSTSRVEFDKVKIGPYKLENKSIWLLESKANTSEDGLLGMDFLGAYGYKVDQNRSVVIWGTDP